MNSEKVQICGAGFSYEAHVGAGLIEETGRLAREKVRGHRAAVITDSNVPETITGKVEASLAAAGFQVTKVTVASGEKSKSLVEVERICGKIPHLDRSSVVIGVGGGMIGDLSGFVAAVFHRGIPHVQIPTTLLAMVDSAIGGKTGVNLATGKNLIGAVHHPALVIADLETLETLPERELRQGFAEVVKHAIIRDAEMFAQMKVAQGLNVPFDKNASWKLAPLVARNIRIKAAIVSADDREIAGERVLLNFGHTVGHGIERASEFRIPHGECVSLGIVAAVEISMRKAGLPEDQRNAIVAVLDQLGLPTRWPEDIAREQVMEAIQHDKKFEDGVVRFVLTPCLGEVFVSREVTLEDIRGALARL